MVQFDSGACGHSPIYQPSDQTTAEQKYESDNCVYCTQDKPYIWWHTMGQVGYYRPSRFITHNVETVGGEKQPTKARQRAE